MNDKIFVRQELKKCKCLFVCLFDENFSRIGDVSILILTLGEYIPLAKKKIHNVITAIHI